MLFQEEHVKEDDENEVEYRAKPTKSRKAPKSKPKDEKEEKKQKSGLKSKKDLTPEKSEESIENDTDVLTMKQTSKQIVKSPNSSKGSSVNDEIGDLEELPKTPETKPKRVRKGKQTRDVEKEEKVIKPTIKRGGGRKAKVEVIEDEAKQISPPESNDEEVFKTGDFPDVIDTPESDQKTKPTVTKRKPKAKPIKK